MKENRFGRVADPWPLDLGVEHDLSLQDRPSNLRPRTRAVAGVVFDDRDARLLDDGPDQRLAAAGDHQVDVLLLR